LSNLTQGSGGPQDPEILYTPADITQILAFLEIEYAETENHFSDHGESDRGNSQIDCVVRAKKKAV